MKEREYIIGDRVGAILSADATTISMFGYGTYDGEFQPPFWNLDEMEQVARELMPDEPENEIQEFLTKIVRNPKITLDNGKVVWGCQCWWGDEDSIKKMIGSRSVVMIDVDEIAVIEKETDNAEEKSKQEIR